MTTTPSINGTSLRLTIIIPTYNEADNVGLLIDQIDQEVTEQNKEILVVDDNSPDGTAQAVERLMETRDDLRLIVRREDRGLVQSIREGIRSAKGDVVVWLDADLTMPPRHINEFLDHIDAGADLVIGSRYVEGGGIKGAEAGNKNTSMARIWKNTRESKDGIFSLIISKVGNLTVRHLLDPRYYDYTSGFYGVRRSVFDHIEIEGKYLDYCIRFLYEASKQGLRIKEIPVVMRPRINGESKTSGDLFTLLQIIFDCFWTIFYITWRRKG